MCSIGSRRFLASIGVLAFSLLAGCTVTEVNPAYKPTVKAGDIEPNYAKLTIGNFSDSRGAAPEWLGEFRARWTYPRSTLRSTYPVTKVVRDMIVRGAEDRLMLAGNGTNARVYQLYGQVNKLEAWARVPVEARARAHLTTRLIRVANNEELYSGTHQVDLSNLDIDGDPEMLGRFVEEALNKAVQDALDDPEFRAALTLDDF